MRRRSDPRLAKVLVLALALLPAAAPLPALSFISAQVGKFVLGNVGAEGDVSPILTTVGALVPIIEIGPFRFEVSTLLWGTVYEWVPADSATNTPGRAVPTQWETANQIGVLGVWASPLASLFLRLAGGKVELGVTGGVAFNLRFPVFERDDDGNGKADHLGDVYKYFFTGRFLFPETRLWARWCVPDSNLAISLTLSVLYPVSQLVDKRPFPDQFFFAAIAGFDFRLPPRKARAAPAKEAPQEQAPPASDSGAQAGAEGASP